MPIPQETTFFQGEIAYVLDGDLWLHDLISGEARQLTTDGDNLEPNWFPNGRYLVYSRGADLESADLYLLDVESRGEAQLLVEQACCGAWSPDGERIAYVDLSGAEPALRSIQPDGSGEETLVDPLTYGRGAYPMGKLDWVSEEYLLAPLEIIAEESLDIYRDVIVVNLWTESGEEALAEEGCIALSADAVTAPESNGDDLLALAVAFEQAEESCSRGQTAKGIDIDWFNDNDGRDFPWLAAPSLSADGTFLAAERYVESADPATADLWGVVVVNTLTGDEVAVAEGASQPAWRPAPPLDPAALRFVQPGERLVTLGPPLLYDGKRYQISYLTTGDLQRRDAEFFHLASPSFFADEEVRGLVVTSDGRAVTDAELLRVIFDRYHAAYHLYVEPPSDLLPLLGEELDTVLGNPLLMAMSPVQFLTSARNQNAAALRAMLSVWNGEDGTLRILDEVIADANEDAETALEVLGAIIEDQYQTNQALIALHADLKVAYESSQETVAWGGASLTLLRLVGELLVLSEHQQERADWLQTYVDSFPSGVGGLNRDQLRATATVLAEAEDDYQQRLNLVVDFAKLEGTKALVQGGTRLTQQAAADLIAQLAAKYGASLSSQAVASLLSTVSVGLTVNSVLYGTDDLVANFQLARRSEDLRATFRAAAADVQNQAGRRAGANADGRSVRVYDGDLAERYRIAVLLDTLAGVAAYHAYADGVAASQRIPNLLTLINTLRGEAWQAAAEGLHRSADSAERTVLKDLNNPAMLDAAVTLALTRMRPQATTDGESLVEPTTGMAFVFVPAGEFVMGSENGYLDEQPQRTVYVDDYWIGQTEVTNAQFQHFVDAGGYETERYWSTEGWQARVEYDWTGPRCLDDSTLNAPEQPVVCVSWYEADAYTRWLSEATGDSYRLPTEAEWEKAARGVDGRTFPWGDDFDGLLLNFCDVNCSYSYKNDDYDDGYEYAAPVGSYPDGVSPYGALDMAGNVWEWVNDWYKEDYYSVAPDSNPQGPATGNARVSRGGSWYFNGDGVRSADRNYVHPGHWYYDLGFRCVRSPTNPPPAIPPFVSSTPTPLPVPPTSTPIVTPTPMVSSETSEEILIPAGSFQMGCSPNDSECDGDEYPLHTVELEAYYIDKYEVTNARYQRCVNEGDCTPPGNPTSYSRSSYFGNPQYDNYPVVNINWYQADTFCAWEGKRLPTEAEWEKAARGTDGRIYPWGNQPPNATLLNHAGSAEGTTPVGSYPAGASPYGVMDMAGNVYEWVNDRYQSDYYSNSPTTNPLGPGAGDYRVLRGGSWLFIAMISGVRSTDRDSQAPGFYYFVGDGGFRCARSVKSTDVEPAHDESDVPPQDVSEKLTSYTLTEQPGDDFLCFGPCPKLCRFGCDSIQVTHVSPLNITTADQANGIEQKWCAEVQLIAKDEDNTWLDKRIYYEIAQSKGQLIVLEGTVWVQDMGITPICRSTGADNTKVKPTTDRTFVFIPAGEFVMGSTEEQVDAPLEWCNESYGGCDRAWFESELPQRTVYLDDYWMGQTEVTNAHFQHFVDAGGYTTERYWSNEGWQARIENSWTGPRCLDDSNLNAPDQPVVCVSWYEADAYTRWLSETTGDIYRLPTEAEWEKAARGVDGRTFPWGDDFDGILLNFCDVNCPDYWKDSDYDDGYEYTAPVGSYPDGASPYGALDMAGNVLEWVSDRYGESYYSVAPDSNPQGPDTGTRRVLRGGAWRDSGSDVRSAFRGYVSHDYWGNNGGFRCVRSP